MKSSPNSLAPVGNQTLYALDFVWTGGPALGRNIGGQVTSGVSIIQTYVPGETVKRWMRWRGEGLGAGGEPTPWAGRHPAYGGGSEPRRRGRLGVALGGGASIRRWRVIGGAG